MSQCINEYAVISNFLCKDSQLQPLTDTAKYQSQSCTLELSSSSQKIATPRNERLICTVIMFYSRKTSHLPNSRFGQLFWFSGCTPGCFLRALTFKIHVTTSLTPVGRQFKHLTFDYVH